MQDCKKYQEMILAEVDGQHSKELGEHLKSCSTCSKMLFDLKLIKKEMKAMSNLKVSSAFNDRLKEKLAQGISNNQKIKKISLVRKIVSYASGVAAVLLTVAILNNYGMLSFEDKQIDPSYSVIAENEEAVKDSKLEIDSLALQKAKKINQNEEMIHRVSGEKK